VKDISGRTHKYCISMCAVLSTRITATIIVILDFSQIPSTKLPKTLFSNTLIASLAGSLAAAAPVAEVSDLWLGSAESVPLEAREGLP
jgi:hypothetical protein